MHNFAARIEGEKIFSLIDACEDKFSAWKYTSKSARTQILVFESHNFWRTNTNYGVILTFDLENDKLSKLNVTVAGGAVGLFQLDLGSENSLLDKIQKAVQELATQNSLRVKQVDAKESGWTNRLAAPGQMASRSFLKKCLNCGKEIPIASKECEYCGASQPKSG
jgi:hypothetical protein